MTDFWIAPNAIVCGHVELGKHSSVWYGAVLRGDLAAITVGELSNIQDGAVLHGDPEAPIAIGARVTIGHRAIIHAATLADDCLIGMGAVILNGVTIGAGSIVAAGAVVTKSVPEQTLVAGVPAKPLRSVSDVEVEDLRHHAHDYWQLAQQHARGEYPLQTAERP